VGQPIGRKDSKQTVIPTSRRLDSFFYEAAQNFEIFKYSRSTLKNPKHTEVDVLFMAYPNNTTLRLIQSDRTVPVPLKKIASIYVRGKVWLAKRGPLKNEMLDKLPFPRKS
jgi:hypothetical protein